MLYIYILHNATRVGRNPMLRADNLHAYMLTCLHAYMLACLRTRMLTCLHACTITCLHASRSFQEPPGASRAPQKFRTQPRRPQKCRTQPRRPKGVWCKLTCLHAYIQRVSHPWAKEHRPHPGQSTGHIQCFALIPYMPTCLHAHIRDMLTCLHAYMLARLYAYIGEREGGGTDL